MNNTRIEIYAWIGESLFDGTTAIMTASLRAGSLHPIPLLSCRRELAEELIEVVAQSVGHQKPRLVRFIEAETIRVAA